MDQWDCTGLTLGGVTFRTIVHCVPDMNRYPKM